jgi:hypothetical protein
MTANDILVVVSILVGVLALITATVKAISKVVHIFDVLEGLTKAVVDLTLRMDTLDQRMYENAVRNSQRR